MQQLLQSLLDDEITDQDFYDEIIDFIHSSNIRSGEYECNRFIIKKMDKLNFIIFEEYEIDGKKEIHNTISINKRKLTNLVNKYAKKQGFTLRDFF